MTATRTPLLPPCLKPKDLAGPKVATRVNGSFCPSHAGARRIPLTQATTSKCSLPCREVEMRISTAKRLPMVLMPGHRAIPSPSAVRRLCPQRVRGGNGIPLAPAKAGGIGAVRKFLGADPRADVRMFANTLPLPHASRKPSPSTAHMDAMVFDTRWISLKVIREEDTVANRHCFLVWCEAAPHSTEDGFSRSFLHHRRPCGRGTNSLGRVLRKVLMPWGAPNSVGHWLNNVFGRVRNALRISADVPLVIDAASALPSHAAQAMELGFECGWLLNTAVPNAGDPAGHGPKLLPLRSAPVTACRPTPTRMLARDSMAGAPSTAVDPGKCVPGMKPSTVSIQFFEQCGMAGPKWCRWGSSGATSDKRTHPPPCYAVKIRQDQSRSARH